jgi:translocation and assembly module TamB
MIVRRRSRWQAWVLGVLALLVALVVAALLWLDSAGGHRYVASRISALTPASGLRIKVAAIEGSLYKHVRLRGVELADRKGRFLAVPEARMQWFPFAWLANRLEIDSLVIPQARLDRLPQLKPSGRKRPILPDFDIRVGDLRVGRLLLGPAVAGKAHVAELRGRADIRSRRAIVQMGARALDTQDRLQLSLDSRPDANRFDLDLQLFGPRGGILAGAAGLERDVRLAVDGRGDWRRWRGRLAAVLGTEQVAALDLAADAGRYRAEGTLAPTLLGKGLAARLAAPRLGVAIDTRLANRVLDGRLALRSAALRMEAEGAIDLARSSFDNLLVEVGAGRAEALLKQARGQDVRLRLRLDGPFRSAAYEYLLRAPELRFGKARIVDLRGQGQGRLSERGPTLVPLRVTARRVDGQGPVLDGILRDVSVAGTLQIAGSVVTSTPIAIRTSKVRGDLILLANLARGTLDAGFTGDLKGLDIPRFGLVDMTARVTAAQAPRGGFQLTGRAAAALRRLDNAFLRGLAGGLPRATSDLRLGADGRLHFAGLTLDAPALRLRANGYRRPDGQVRFEGSGEHDSYGPVRLVLDGRIDRPHADLVLARPLDALGLREVKAELTPDAAGYVFTAAGGSTLGPFAGGGAILLPPGAPALIRVDRIAVADALAAGALTPVTGGFDGRLDVTGRVTGTIGFQPVSGVQRIILALAANAAQFAGPPAIGIGRGTVQATILLNPGATSVDANVQAGGVLVGRTRIGRLAGRARLVNGAGTVNLSLGAQRGRLFDLQARARIEPGRAAIDLAGTLARQPIRFANSAMLTREDGGWRLAPTVVDYRGGTAELAGLFGGAATQLRARLDRLPLALADLANPDLGLGGTISGQVRYDLPRGGNPSGEARVTVRGLTRSGLAISATPVDLGVNAVLNAHRAAVRAIVRNGATVIGRAQAMMTPLGAGGTIIERIANAPMRAQVRYSGNADTLWRLTNVELFTLSGPATISADVAGTLADPVIAGSVSTSGARLQSPVTGMTLTGLTTQGRFDGSQLILGTLRGQTKGGGTLDGSARFTFGLNGLGIDLSARASRAVLLDRDDIAATVTGPLTVRSDGNGGVIGGDLDVISSRFVLGRAASVAEIPELRVVEVNRRGEEFESATPASPWRLDIHANARNRLMVTGLGMDSEWRADLQIGGTVTQPTITGRADLVRGSYDFAGKRFDLRDGALRFTGSTPINPTLAITAQSDVSDINATIRVTGTSAQPEIDFSSIPALPEDELLSRLLFGTSITNLSAPEAIQLAAAVAAFQGRGGGGLDPINAVRKATGLSRLRILPADQTTGQQTSVAAGKYLSRRIYVELITDGQGYSATRVEYQITRWLSLLSSVSTVGRQSANVRVSKDY